MLRNNQIQYLIFQMYKPNYHALGCLYLNVTPISRDQAFFNLLKLSAGKGIAIGLHGESTNGDIFSLRSFLFNYEQTGDVLEKCTSIQNIYPQLFTHSSTVAG